MNRQLRTSTVLLIGLWLTAPDFARADGLPRGDARAEGFAPEALKRIDALLGDAVARRQIAGGAALVARHGKVVYLATSGKSDVESGRPIDEATIYRIASMTKPITSVAVMMLHEEGKLGLEDPVSRFLPEFKDQTVLGGARASREITIHNLLTHTSGLSYRFFDRPGLGKLYIEAGVSDGLSETPGTIGENVTRLARLPLLHQPGTAWEYGLNIDVLGRVVEVASGRTLDEFFRERIFRPLRMDNTSFVVPESKRARLAALYAPGPDGAIRRVGPGRIEVGALIYSTTYSTHDGNAYFSGGAGLCSTIGDYARFLQMLLNRGELDGVRLLRPETVDLMTRNQIGDLQIGFPHHGDGFGYGFGVLTSRGKTEAFRKSAYDDVASVGTFSWGGIFYTYFWADPERQMIGILMTQILPSDHLKLREEFKRIAYEALADPRSVRVSETTLHGDMDCFEVETPTATYLYGKRGAGFASILDRDGRDWVSYRPGNKAKGEYRGLPKCGQPTKFFHCGYGYGQYPTDNPFTSRITTREESHVRIESETRDGKSACAWDFYPDHATLTLLRIGQPTYWFLYEGTPGGKLDAKGDFVLRPDGTRTSLDEPWSQVVPWACFGAVETPVGLVLVDHQEPEPGAMDSYVSWPFQRESDGSFQDMTVFGFGRKGYKELIQHVPDLKKLPARFSIGFIERADPAVARAAVERYRADSTGK